MPWNGYWCHAFLRPKTGCTVCVWGGGLAATRETADFCCLPGRFFSNSRGVCYRVLQLISFDCIPKVECQHRVTMHLASR